MSHLQQLASTKRLPRTPSKTHTTHTHTTSLLIYTLKFMILLPIFDFIDTLKGVLRVDFDRTAAFGHMRNHTKSKTPQKETIIHKAAGQNPHR